MTLQIFLLGQFRLQAKGDPFELPSRPAQSLMAYMVLNAGVAFRRERLAALQWPDATDSNARNYLRGALWRIRKSLESAGLTAEEYLITSDISLSFSAQSDYWLDVEPLMAAAGSASVDELIEQVRLYRGELLPGFSEGWIPAERHRIEVAYHQKMDALLDGLCAEGRWREVLDWGEAWIQLGHSPEAAYRALMRAHAATGDQRMISATYQRCLAALQEELGLDPSPETRALFDEIIREPTAVPGVPKEKPSDFEHKRPSFLVEDEPERLVTPRFVARKQELERLHGLLQNALEGEGRVAMIVGGAGSGKSALIRAFTLRALERHPDLVVAGGNCNAHTGLGDPYLPWREILGLLTGDVQSRWAARALAKGQARRLWDTLPRAAAALVEQGPDLIDAFIPGGPLLERARASGIAGGEWLGRLEVIAKRAGPVPLFAEPQQSGLIDQYTRLICALSRQVPLMLVLDDLQWADSGSIELLFHLGRQLIGFPLLVIGAYRGEEVALGRAGERHPLEAVVNEFRRQHGDIVVDLARSDSTEFVNSYLDSEPNLLTPVFRDKLRRQTQGHPLFTIELLRGMQERGDLVEDANGRWVEGPDLDWETLPARVEAVIAERIGRLPPQLREALEVASVEGEVFTAEVITQVVEADERELLARLSGDLDRRHQLIHAESIIRSHGQLISSYRFRHILFQKYIYGSLDAVRRVHLHEAVGRSLERLYAGTNQIPHVALQLARHFQVAGVIGKAIDYLQVAGEHAVRLAAYQEGVVHLSRALGLLNDLPQTPDREDRQLALQLAYARAWKYQGPTGRAMETISDARALCQRMGRIAELSRVLGELSIYHYVRAEYSRAKDLAQEALALAKQAAEPSLEAEGHWYLGLLDFCLGDYVSAQNNLGRMTDFYIPEKHHQLLISVRGVDAGLSAMAYEACCLWCLGFPDQAIDRSEEVLHLARRYDHPFTLADTLCYAGCMLRAMLRDAEGMGLLADELMSLTSEKGLRGWLGTASSFKGESVARLGDPEAGIELIKEGIELSDAAEARLYRPLILRSLALAHEAAGDLESGLGALDRAFSAVEATDERHWEAELHRLRGRFSAGQGDLKAAESSYLQAVDVARRQGAKSWELRGVTALARLWNEQGRKQEAIEILAPLYAWFSEGFDTLDLVQARALLEALDAGK